LLLVESSKKQLGGGSIVRSRRPPLDMICNYGSTGRAAG
jgi:hypothetical protein